LAAEERLLRGDIDHVCGVPRALQLLLRERQLSVFGGNGTIGPITFGGRELVRRLFVTVRDSEWREVVPASWHVGQGSRALTFEVRHYNEDVEFRWSGKLSVEPERRRLTFGFRGVAGRAMSVCRLGLVVLIPLQQMEGAQVRQSGPDGEKEIRLGRYVAPQLVLAGLPTGIGRPFDKIEIDAAASGRLTCIFEGDTFELEDQRNWGDASFKIYCTPLSFGYPRQVGANAVVEHSVVVEWDERSAVPNGCCHAAIGQSSPGLALGAAGSNPASFELAFRDIEYGKYDAGLQSTKFGNLSSTPVEITIGENQLETLISDPTPLSQAKGALIGLRLVGVGGRPPSDAALARCRDILKTAGFGHRPICAATSYFVEWNRKEALPQSASKGAVRLFSKVAGTQHAHENIRCNSLHPGPIDGGMFRHTFAPSAEALAKRLTRVPMGRLGHEDEIVAGVVFLASDESSFMTAAELVIDGGCVAQ
jgi:hypothetical protein